MLHVHAGTTIVAHPQSSTVIFIYSDRCSHSELHGCYIFITMVTAKFSYEFIVRDVLFQLSIIYYSQPPIAVT